MPEDQKPFIHQDGKSTAPGPTPIARLLNTGALARQVNDLQREQDRRLQSVAERGFTTSDDYSLILLVRSIECLQLLQEPRINTTVGALKRLSPNLQALVSDIAVALVTEASGHLKLANSLRKLIEGRS